ncbi:MAG: DUF3768 domain-containing protein [Caldilineaceae bacterium]
MSHLPTNAKATRIAELNDLARTAMDGTCQVIVTRGIANLPLEDCWMILRKVREYGAFSEDNDPYGERDFGAFTHRDQKIFWKIDYYAPDLMHGSEDPTDPAQTVRVLTIMLASEY